MIDYFSVPQLFPKLLEFCNDIIRFAPDQCKYLTDIGAGTGLFTRYLQDQLKNVHIYAIEPNANMMNCAKQQLNGDRTTFIAQTFDDGFDQLCRQDIIIFQRSLYSFYNNQPAYQTLAEKVYDKLNTNGLLGIYEVYSTYEVKPIKNFIYNNWTNTGWSEDFLDSIWPAYEQAMLDFNSEILDGSFTLFNKNKLENLFCSVGFKLLDTKTKYLCFIKPRPSD